jgi:hypothetical protein
LSETYRIVALGLNEGVDKAQAATQLASLFKTGVAQVAPLLTGERVSVKKGLDLQAASRYHQALEQAGVRSAIEPEDATATSFAAALAAQKAGEFEHARTLYVALAEQGVALASYNLATLYTGDGGLPVDLIEAYKWMGIAADDGEADAPAMRDKLGEALSWVEVANARQRTAAWLGRHRKPGPALPDEKIRLEREAREGRYPVEMLKKLLPRLQPAARRRADIATVPLTDDLSIAFFFAILGRDDFLSPDEIKAIGLAPDTLRDMAINNMHHALQDSFEVARMSLEADDGSGHTVPLFHQLKIGAGLDAACLALPVFWETARQQVKGELRIAVPTRDDCYFCGADEAIPLMAMCDVARDTFAEAGEGALSAQLYTVDADGVVHVVEGAAAAATPRPAGQDPGTPAAPAQTHFASDPGNITLSEARLFKLTPELNDPKEPLETRRKLIDRTAEHLGQGDARAAVVIDAAKGIVAAYTDEMDCVVLLRFERHFAVNERWQDGTRLLTVNRYGFKRDGVAPDLQPAPGAVTEFGNFTPLIADLLTEDRQALDVAKARIGEAEWLRAQALGQALWRKGATPREGRPLWSGDPVMASAAPMQIVVEIGEEEAADKIGFESALKAIGGALVSLFFLIGFARAMVGKPADGTFFFALFVIVAMAGTFIYCARRIAKWMSQ